MYFLDRQTGFTCTSSEAILKSLIYLNSTWRGNADQNNKVLLFSYIISLKWQSISFLFALKRSNYNTKTRKGLQRLWMSTRPWLKRFTPGQTTKLSHFIGDRPGEQTPGLKTKFLQQSPSFLLKKTLSLSPNTFIIFPGERISVWFPESNRFLKKQICLGCHLLT